MDKEIALKILRELHDEALFSERTALETFIPELKESEDEKIRKAILAFVRQSSEVLDKQNQNNMLAWLEKQGNNTPTIIWHNIDEKPKEMEELFCEWESDDATWHDVAFYDEESHTFRHDKMPINVTKWVYVDELLEKQGEQKPMTEEFEHELAEICNQLLSEIDSEWMNNEILDCIGTSVWLNLCDETAKRYKDGLLKLAKQGEQKPAEWGEEDETTFKVMLEELEKYVMFKQYSTPLSVYDLQWFKSLKDRVQP